jgi:hypothetical protein
MVFLTCLLDRLSVIFRYAAELEEWHSAIGSAQVCSGVLFAFTFLLIKMSPEGLRVYDADETNEYLFLLLLLGYGFLTESSPKKCDASKPACGLCTTTGHAAECVYQNVIFQQENTTQIAHSPGRNLAQKALANANRLGPEMVFIDHNVEWWKLEDVPAPLDEFL